MIIIHDSEDKTFLYSLDYLEFGGMKKGKSDEVSSDSLVEAGESTLRLFDKKRKVEMLISFSNQASRDNWKSVLTPLLSANSSSLPRPTKRSDSVSAK
jgi:hypothetical protein